MRNRNIFGRVKDWWNDLSENDRTWLKVVGIWTVDGYLAGTLVTTIFKERKLKKAVETSAVDGYYVGRMDAYKEMLSNTNPYALMDIGMKKLENQGKVRKF